MQIIKKRKEARKALKNIPTSDESVDETGNNYYFLNTEQTDQNNYFYEN